MTELVGDVTVVAWLLGGVGAEQAAAALHGPRLESALEKLVDTPVRGLVYERAAAAPDPVRDRGIELVESASRRWHIPLVVLRARGEDRGTWPSALAAAVEGVIGPAGRSHF